MESIINAQMPEFKVQAYHNNEFVTVSSEDLKGKWAVFFFYPADFTFICPTELEDLASKYEELKKMGVEVFSVSVDSAYVHKAWSDASPTINKIEYTMISDIKHELADFFDTFSEEDGQAYRGSFVVDPEGIVRSAEICDMGVGRSAAELVRKVQACQFVAKHGEVCPAKWTPGDKTLNPEDLGLVGKI